MPTSPSPMRRSELCVVSSCTLPPHRSVAGVPTRPSAIGLRKDAQLLRHAEIVAIGEVISDSSVSNLVPVNVLNLESLASRFDANQEAAIDPLGCDSPSACH